MAERQPARLARQGAFDHLDAVVAQTRQSLAGDARIGIDNAVDEALDARGDERVGARRGLAPMRAGLERGVDRGAARGLTGGGQRDRFGMRAPAAPRPGAADDAAIAAVRDHDPDGRVRPALAETAPAERQRERHR